MDGNGRGIDDKKAELRRLHPAESKDAIVDSNGVSPIIRRQQTKAACAACRKRKSKCSGGRPNCECCVTRGTTCVYDTAISDETHTQALKRNYSLLQKKVASYETLLEFLQSQPDEKVGEVLRWIKSGTTLETILNWIIDDNFQLQTSQEPVTSYLDEFFRRHSKSNLHFLICKGSAKSHNRNDNTSSPRIAISHRTSCNDSPTTINDASDGLLCFNHLLSWHKCWTAHAGSVLSDEYATHATVLSLPPHPLHADVSYSPADTWANTGWTKVQLHHLFDALFMWDYLPFSLLCQDLFLRDFHCDSTRFCSIALVHAVLALATRLVNEDRDESEILPSGWRGSKSFFSNAEEMVQSAQPLRVLPDIQALEVISLYQLRCGQETKAQEYAEAAMTHIKELCRVEALVCEEDEEYARARATTFCGAVSLTRILTLTTGSIFISHSFNLQADVSILHRPDQSTTSADKKGCILGPTLAISTNSSQLYNPQAIPAKIFQLTEWVYKLIKSMKSSDQIVSDDILAFHVKCLNWHNNVLALLKAESSRTPFVLFVQMYYHFCLLCAFRPIIGFGVENSGLQPRQICLEATQSIMALAQCYDDLFTLRRVSGLLPYFVCASGLFSLAADGASICLDSMHLRSGHRPTVVNQENAAATSAYIKTSVTDHACLLLSKMGSTHPAANMAEKMLHDAQSLRNSESAR